jgi:hypothetical protein
MIARMTRISALVAAFLFAFTGMAQAGAEGGGALASFDYQSDGGDLQAGFQFVGHSFPRLNVQNNIEAFSGGFNSIGSRNITGFLIGHPLADLLRDWHIDNDSVYEAFIEIRAPNTIDPQDAVLIAGEPYIVRIFHYDNDGFANGRTGFRVYDEDRTDESKFLVEIGDHGSAQDPDLAGCTDIEVVAKPLGPSSTGRIQLEFGPHSDTNRYFFAFNGFQIFNIPSEVPSTSIVVQATAGIGFNSDTGVVYNLECTPDMVSSNFSPTGASVIGDGGSMALFDPTGPLDTNKNYRVVRQ